MTKELQQLLLDCWIELDSQKLLPPGIHQRQKLQIYLKSYMKAAYTLGMDAYHAVVVGDDCKGDDNPSNDKPLETTFTIPEHLKEQGDYVIVDESIEFKEN